MILLFLAAGGWWLASALTASHLHPSTPGPASTVTVPPPVKPVKPQPPHTVMHMMYTVRAGDSLWAISEAHCPTPLDWVSLWHANLKTIGPDPNLIFPGQMLTLTC